MFCIDCGKKLIDGAKFCTECGTKVPKPEPEPEPGPRPDEGYDVMISYSWKPEVNKGRALKLYEKLKKKNFKVWMDVDQMYGNMDERMLEGLKSKVFIACLSKEYQDSDNCKKEYKYAANNKKPIIPVKVANYQPGGWLEFNARDIIYRDVTTDELLETSLPDIQKDIERYIREAADKTEDDHKVDPVNRQPAKPVDPVNRQPAKPEPTSKLVTDKDIKAVVDKLGPDKLQILFSAMDMNADNIAKWERGAGSTTNVTLKATEVLKQWRETEGNKGTREKILDGLAECRFNKAREEIIDKWKANDSKI